MVGGRLFALKQDTSPGPLGGSPAEAVSAPHRVVSVELGATKRPVQLGELLGYVCGRNFCQVPAEVVSAPHRVVSAELGVAKRPVHLEEPRGNVCGRNFCPGPGGSCARDMSWQF